MTSIQQMREKISARAQELHALMADNPETWNDTLQNKYDTGMKEIDSLKASIKRQEDLAAATKDENVINQMLDEGKHKGAQASKAAGVFAKWLRNGPEGLTPEDMETYRVALANPGIRNTMSVGTGSQGGYTVPTEVVPTVVDALKAYGGVRLVATILKTASGHPMDYPNSDGRSEEGEQVGENSAASAADLAFGFSALTTYKYSSKVLKVPFELAQDTAVDLDALIFRRCTQRIGRITNKKFTIGTGSGEPQGVVTAAQSGVVGASGQVSTVKFTDLVNLLHSVDPAYREAASCVYMMHDQTLAAIRQLVDSNNRPIFLPGFDGLGDKMPDTVLGMPVIINQQMATMEASAKSILFGDFSPYIVRDVMDAQMFRFADSAYVQNGQIGYLMWMRCGGAFTDVGNSLMYYQNAAS